MKPISERPATISEAAAGPAAALRIAVTFKGRHSGIGPTRFAAHMSTASVAQFEPDPVDVELAIEALRQRGFTVSGRGRMTVSVRGSRASFESTFGTHLSEFSLSGDVQASAHRFLFPAPGAPWAPDPQLAELIDDAYIQWPHIYMARPAVKNGVAKKSAAKKSAAKKSAAKKSAAKKSAAKHAAAKKTAAKNTSARQPTEPQPAAGRPKRPQASVPSTKAPGSVIPEVPYYHLDVLKDVPRLLDAQRIQQAGGTGEGVRVVMIDTGFAHAHPFFVNNGFRSTVVLAPGATHRDTDPDSHGTGESANIFALAPKVTFIGVKLGDDDDPNGGASVLEGFQEALRHSPQVISVSLGYDLRQGGLQPLDRLPNSLKALEAEIQAAVASGITVVFSAGNGHYSFPGMMPEVLSAGGVYVDQAGQLQASDYASAFSSAIYSGRSVPDVCGLVGLLPHADYILLPVPPGQAIDRDNASHDGTAADDGWAVFSGTSAAAPQLAALCALLLQKNPALTPAAVKAALVSSGRDVTRGHANPSSDLKGKGVAAGPGRDGATGAGLADAYAAWQQV